jgi:hypothetical protein
MARGSQASLDTTVHTTTAAVVFHSPGMVADAVGSNQTAAAASKLPGNPNGAVVGRVPGTSIIFRNPA